MCQTINVARPSRSRRRHLQIGIVTSGPRLPPLPTRFWHTLITLVCLPLSLDASPTPSLLSPLMLHAISFPSLVACSLDPPLVLCTPQLGFIIHTFPVSSPLAHPSHWVRGPILLHAKRGKKGGTPLPLPVGATTAQCGCSNRDSCASLYPCHRGGGMGFAGV